MVRSRGKVKMKQIHFVTGTRADYGKLEPLAESAVKAGYQVYFFVTGMHLLNEYGLTKLEVHANNKFYVHEFLNQKASDDQETIIAKTVTGFSDYVAEHKPDLIIVHGDRVEAFACALVCATNRIRCAHIEGGEVSGTIDEIFRHCITKMASNHFVSSQAAAKRVMAMGEQLGSIHIIGSPELDIHGAENSVSLDQVFERYALKEHDYGLVIFHPVTYEVESLPKQTEILFNALKNTNRHFIVIKPNNDPGSRSIMEVIEKLDQNQFRILPSVRFSNFSVLLQNSAVLVGNSSTGVREAPFFGVPSLNIGTRQLNRSTAGSITTIETADTKMITEFIEQEWRKRYARNHNFGDGNASKEFLKIIQTEDFWAADLQKNFFDYHE